MMTWWKKLSGSVRLKEPLANKTTFKIGGEAEFFVEPRDYADLKLALNLAKRHHVPILVIGAGSNILISDSRIGALVLRLSSPFFKRVISSGNFLQSGSGVLLSELILAAARSGLSGIEFLAGIPGTVGGALSMNAGAWGRSIADLVESVEVMDYNGVKRALDKKDIRFGYRKSSLAKSIVLNACLRLAKRNKKEIKDNIRQYILKRRSAQDNSLPNIGCIFKNPAKEPAGKLIDLCGLKGSGVGGAFISGRHANFILNRGNASSSDVLELIRLIQGKVKQKFNINLEPEIKIWK